MGDADVDLKAPNVPCSEKKFLKSLEFFFFFESLGVSRPFFTKYEIGHAAVFLGLNLKIWQLKCTIAMQKMQKEITKVVMKRF